MTVTFCGHRDVCCSHELRGLLYDSVESLIRQGAVEFLLGGYGNFDIMAAHVVKELKEKYFDIRSVMVIPYIDRKYNKELYDISEYPLLENVPKRFAIVKRNEYMVDKSDAVVAYVNDDFGGAARMLRYAERKSKTVINIAKLLIK